MASIVSICNLALSHLAKPSIASLAEQSAEAIACAAVWDQARDATLRDHAWNFATCVATLARVAEGYAGFAYAYACPHDCLAARRLIPVAGRPHGEIPFRLLNRDGRRVVATDVAPATLEYTARVEDANLYDPAFVDALAWQAASRIALRLTGDLRIRDGAMQGYQMALAQARALDAREGAAGEAPDAEWVRGRE